MGTVSAETTGARPALPGAVRRAVAVRPAEARVGETPVCRGFKTAASEPTGSQNAPYKVSTYSLYLLPLPYGFIDI